MKLFGAGKPDHPMADRKEAARLLGEKTGYGERGYRVSCNVGPEGGQVVYHLHFHLTAGRRG